MLWRTVSEYFLEEHSHAPAWRDMCSARHRACKRADPSWLTRDGQVEVGPRATGPVAIMHKVLGETLAVRTVCERAAVGNRTGRQAERFRGRKERRRARRRVGLKENSKWSLATGCRMRPRWAWEGVGEGASARESEGQISAHSPSPPQRPTPDRAANIKMLARWPAIGRERLRAMIAARASPALPSSL